MFVLLFTLSHIFLKDSKIYETAPLGFFQVIMEWNFKCDLNVFQRVGLAKCTCLKWS